MHRRAASSFLLEELTALRAENRRLRNKIRWLEQSRRTWRDKARAWNFNRCQRQHVHD